MSGVLRVRQDRRQPEVTWRLVRGVVPALAAGHAVQRAQERPRLALVAALEDAGGLDAGEDPPVRGGQSGDLRQLRRALTLAVAEALARGLPRLAEVAAAPDRGAVPFARRCGVEVAAFCVVDRVVDRPALAVGPEQLPVSPVRVALQDEASLARSDEDDGLRHLLHLRGRFDVDTAWTVPRGRTHRSVSPPGRRRERNASASVVHAARTAAAIVPRRRLERETSTELGRSASTESDFQPTS